MTDTKFSFIKKILISSLKHWVKLVDYVKTNLMPDFDFDAYNHDEMPEMEGEVSEVETDNVAAEIEEPVATAEPVTSPTATSSNEEVDKW